MWWGRTILLLVPFWYSKYNSTILRCKLKKVMSMLASHCGFVLLVYTWKFHHCLGETTIYIHRICWQHYSNRCEGENECLCINSEHLCFKPGKGNTIMYCQKLQVSVIEPKLCLDCSNQLCCLYHSMACPPQGKCGLTIFFLTCCQDWKLVGMKPFLKVSDV